MSRRSSAGNAVHCLGEVAAGYTDGTACVGSSSGLSGVAVFVSAELVGVGSAGWLVERRSMTEVSRLEKHKSEPP